MKCYGFDNDGECHNQATKQKVVVPCGDFVAIVKLCEKHLLKAEATKSLVMSKDEFLKKFT